MTVKKKVTPKKKAATRASSRPSRTPISGNRDILTASGIPEDYIGRWVNDVDNRIEKYQSAGYDFVTDDGVTVGDRTVNSGENVGSVVTKNVGNGVIAYLMAQPKEYYDEDKAAIHSQIDEREAAITNRREDGQYGEIKITRK